MTETEAKNFFVGVFEEAKNNLKADGGRMAVSAMTNRLEKSHNYQHRTNDMYRDIFNDIFEIVSAYSIVISKP